MTEAEYSIVDLIPHRIPFLFVDRVIFCEQDGGVFSKAVSWGDMLTPDGLLPRPIVIEALAQSAAAFLGWETRQAGGVPGSGFLAALEKFEFVGDARPGEVIRMKVRRTRVFGPMVRFEAEAAVEDRVLASGILTVALE